MKMFGYEAENEDKENKKEVNELRGRYNIGDL